MGAIAAHGEIGGGHAESRGDVITSAERRTGSTYTLRRLKRDHPALAAKVVGGKLSANAAAIEAGFRVRTISVPLDVAKATPILRAHFMRVELQRMAATRAQLGALSGDA